MKKRILASIAVLALVGALVPATVFGATTGMVTCTVSAYLVSVSVSNGSVDYGVLNLGAVENTAKYDATYNTDGMNTPQTQLVTNTGTVHEVFQIKTSNAVGVTDWTLGETADSDTFTHAFNMADTAYTGGEAIVFTKWVTANSYVAAGTETAPGFDNHLELEIGMPTSASDYEAHTITVTVLAVAS